MDNPIAVKGATEFYYLLSGTENLDDKLPENKFLKKFKFVDEKYRLVEKGSTRLVDREGRYVDEYGNYIQYNEDGTYYYVDLNGRRLDEKTGNFVVDEPAPFLDEYGNPISEDEDEVVVEQKPKKKTTRKRRTTKKAETVKTVDANA